MRKRIFLLLSILLVLSSVSVSAAESVELEPIIREQFEAYASSIDVENAADLAQDDMIRHARNGAHEDLAMGEGDAMTAVVLNSALYRYIFPQIAARAIELMQNKIICEISLRGNIIWYDHSYSSLHRQYESAENGTGTSKAKEVLYNQSNLRETVKPNQYDDVMELVGGGTMSQMKFREIKRENGLVTYAVSVTVYDDFNFDADYSASKEQGKDTTKAELLTLLGKLLGLQSFHWSVESDFQLTVPAKACDHSNYAYHWVYTDDKNLVSSTENGFTENCAEKLGELKADGTPSNPYFRLDRTVILQHGVPWVLEMQGKGAFTQIFSPGETIDGGSPYLLRTQRNSDSGIRRSDQMFFIGNYRYLTEEEKQGENEGVTSVRDYYGVDLTDNFSSGKVQTYRLENRIAEDGSNTVWLFVDGEEIGPMVNYYQWKSLDTGHVNYEVQINWANGKDFYISYISNATCRMPNGMRSVTVWENGQDAWEGETYVQSYVEPTCTEQGGMRYTCLKCGDYYWENSVPSMGGHKLKTEPAVPATCTEPGLTEHSWCTVCGEVVASRTVEDALGHQIQKVPAVAATCTEAGLTEGEYCRRCDEVVIPQTEIPAQGHQSDGVAFCGKESCCTACGEVLRKAGNHSWDAGTVISKHTCTEDGKVRCVCEVCGAEIINRIRATGHRYGVSFDWRETLSETSAEAVCEKCGIVETSSCLVSGETCEDGSAVLTAEVSFGEQRFTEKKMLTAVRMGDTVTVILPVVPKNLSLWVAGYDSHGRFRQAAAVQVTGETTQIKATNGLVKLFFLGKDGMPIFPNLIVK